MRIEILQILDAFADADLEDREGKLVGNGQCNAALGRAIELRHDQSVELERLVELTRLLQTVLPRRRVDDEKGRHGNLRALADDVDDLLELAHKIVGSVQPAGGVDQDEICVILLGALDRLVAHARRIAAAFARDDIDAGALRPHLKLFNGGSAERVGTA